MTDGKPWYEQDTFWEVMGPNMFTASRVADATAEVENMITLLGLQPGMNVLDLCCGVGRHSLEFARRGYHVVAVDRTQMYLDKAKSQAKAEGLDIDFIQADMRDYSKPEAFDAIINLYTSFGFFEDLSDDRQVVTNMYNSLKTNGVVIIDMMGKEVLARIFQARDWHEENGAIYLQERRLSQAWCWIDNRWIMIKDGKTTEIKFSHRLYSAAEISTLLLGCGFISTKVYGDFTGVDYDQKARRLVVIGHK